jgi:hypothetical protein
LERHLAMKFVLLVLFTTAVCSTGCNPRQLPGFKQEAERQDARVTRETDVAIEKSPAFRDLNRLCIEEIPRPKSFVLVQKGRSYNGETFLAYYYQSTDDYESVKRFYTTYFADHGWILTNQKDGGWGPSSIEFHNEDHRVTIEDVPNEETIYAVTCGTI